MAVNKPDTHPQHPNLQPPIHPYYEQNNDEIDLRELFKALWDGKWIVIACTLIFAIGAISYSLTTQEWWSSKAKIVAPQAQDFVSYQLQVKQFQPVFDVYQEDGTVLVSRALNGLIDNQKLFFNFVTAFNSNANKKLFLDNNQTFQKFKNNLDKNTDLEADTAKRRLYSEWYKKISAVTTDKKKELSPYKLVLQATSKDASYQMLLDYVKFVSEVVHQDMLSNLNATVQAKNYELLQQKIALVNQTKMRLDIEVKRAKYALGIARAAKVEQPIQNLGENELFAINLGSSAIEAKIKALDSITDLGVIEPRLQQIDAKLSLLKETKIDRNIKYQTFQYLEEPEPAVFRDEPKRSLISVVGCLLGGMLGIAIVMVRFIFRD